MKRTQILFPEDELRRLQRYAAARHCSVGHLVREAVAKSYGEKPEQARHGITERIAAMDLPVADWPQMEEEIERGKYSDE
jgi:hypothetical protein